MRNDCSLFYIGANVDHHRLKQCTKICIMHCSYIFLELNFINNVRVETPTTGHTCSPPLDGWFYGV
jgi:hypothetical protein